MITFNVSFKSINGVQEFVNIVGKYQYDVDLVSGRYVVNAKSIMGIYSLDLSKPIEVNAYTDNADELKAELKDFIC